MTNKEILQPSNPKIIGKYAYESKRETIMVGKKCNL
jgi:hypothetical protein